MGNAVWYVALGIVRKNILLYIKLQVGIAATALTQTNVAKNNSHQSLNMASKIGPVHTSKKHTTGQSSYSHQLSAHWFPPNGSKRTVFSFQPLRHNTKLKTQSVSQPRSTLYCLSSSCGRHVVDLAKVSGGAMHTRKCLRADEARKWPHHNVCPLMGPPA